MKRRLFTGTPSYCHICGLRIPDNVVSQNHPLFGTVDHVIPKVHGGGKLGAGNRKAAHVYCNRKKGCLSPDRLTNEFRESARTQIIQYMMSCPEWVKWTYGKNVSAARRRTLQTVTRCLENKRDRHILRLESVQRWEDDGGPCFHGPSFPKLSETSDSTVYSLLQ